MSRNYLSVSFLFCLFVSCTTTPSKHSDSSPVGISVPPKDTFGTFDVSPNNGQGKGEVFTVRLVRAPGSAPPTMIGFLVNVAADGSKACYLFHNPATQETFLVNDSGQGSKILGHLTTIGNNQCDLIAGQTASTSSSSDIIVKLQLRFRRSFEGPKTLYAIAQDEKGVSAGFQAVGRYIVE